MAQWISALICALAVIAATSKEIVQIGGIFPRGSEAAESVFRSGLISASRHAFEFQPVIQTPAHVDSYTLYNTACDIINTDNGIAALFVSFEDDSGRAISVLEGLAARAGIPLILTDWKPPTEKSKADYHSITFNYYPDTKSTSTAIAALIDDYDWGSFTVLYDDEFGLIQLQEVLNTRPFRKTPLTIRKLEPDGENGPLLKEIRDTAETRILLNCKASRAKAYLQQASEVDFFGEYQSYLLSSLNAQTIELPESKNIRSNVTTIRAIDPKQPELFAELRQWRQEAVVRGYEDAIPLRPQGIQLETALVADAVLHVTTAYEKISSSQVLTTRAMDCSNLNSETEYPDNPLTEEMLKTSIQGFSGNILFELGTDNVIRRTKVSYDFVEHMQSSFNKTAEWDGENSMLVLTLTESQKSQQYDERKHNKTFQVVSKVGVPYLMLRKEEDGEQLVGNDRYEGYVPDLMKLLARELDIKYNLSIVKGYGKYDSKKNKWDGLIGELLERRADLALGDLSITYDRRSVVDFTSPFMNLGISILARIPKKQPPDPYSFLKPFSFEVWMYVATAYLAVSITLFVVARISPADWESPHPCDKETEELENIWHIKNCTWLTMGSIMTQGSDILPKAVGSRWVTGMWWFFTLIMTSSYTANMAAFLTKDQTDDPISNAAELASQTKIKYGAVKDGSTANFFKYSNNTVYKRMWEAMQSDPTVFMANNDEASERVLQENSDFAFLMESTSIEYLVERHCSDLQQVGRLLDNKGYGIAMPVNSPYRALFDNAILRMAENSKLQELKNLWWKQKYGAGSCVNTATENPMDASKLGVKNVGGVFLVLGAGAGLSCVVAMIELLWHVRDITVTEKISQSEALKAELKFSLNIFRGSKPVLNQQSQSRSSSESRTRSRSRSRAVSILRAATSFIDLDKVY